MQQISNLATLPDYDPTLTLGPDDFEGLSVDVWNNSVIMQTFSLPGGHSQQGTWGVEQLVAPSTVDLSRCGGVRFKTNPGGSPGRIVATGWRSSEPLIVGGVQLAGTLGTAGSVTPPVTAGAELASQSFTANVNITATTEGTANTIVTAPAYTFNGTTVALVELVVPIVQPGSGDFIAFALYDNGASIGLAGSINMPAAAVLNTPFYQWLRFTPTAGAHQFSWRGWRGGANGIIVAGAGGAPATNSPGWIRVTQAA